MALHASRSSGHVCSPRSVRPSPQGREDFSSTTQNEMCTPPQIRHAALAGEVIQGQRSEAMVSADMALDIETSRGGRKSPRAMGGPEGFLVQRDHESGRIAIKLQSKMASAGQRQIQIRPRGVNPASTQWSVAPVAMRRHGEWPPCSRV
jgi:hypothetical protein